LSAAYLALDIGALARHLPITNCTCFGTYLAQRLSPFVVLQETTVVALLVWLLASVSTWPSTNRDARRNEEHAHSHRRPPFVTWFTAP
jgi:hypothetical protein